MMDAESLYKLGKLIDALEKAISEKGELVLGVRHLSLDYFPEPEPTSKDDPYQGVAPDFRLIIDELCANSTDWLKLYLALQLELVKENSRLKDRLLSLSPKLWMTTHYGSLCVWHTAFPPLDGGGSTQVRAFAKVLRQNYRERRFKSCLEWCSGPGFLGFVALHTGVCDEIVLADINPRVVAGIQRTIEHNQLQGKVRYYVSDNLKQVPDSESFDLVLGNPPWAYREVTGLANPLIPNDPKWRIHKEFFEQLDDYLAPQGVVLFSAFEPLKTTAYLKGETEPWDVRPRAPIVDFQRYLEAGGFRMTAFRKAAYDPGVELVDGIFFLFAERAGQAQEPQLDLIGLGGTREESSEPGPPALDFTVFRTIDLANSLKGAQMVDALRVGLSMGEKHLTQVLRDIFQRPERIPEGLMPALGIPDAVVRAFADWNDQESFQYEALKDGLKLVPETCQHPVKMIRIQLTHDGPVCIGLRTLRDLLAGLDHSVRLLVTVKPGFSETKVRELLQTFPNYEADRILFWEHSHQTLFAQDNARLARVGDNSLLLLPGHASAHRPGDSLYGAPIPSLRSSLHWEGGNVLCDGRHVFVGANSIAANIRGLGLTEEQVRTAFSVEMGYPCVVLGDVALALDKAARGDRGVATRHAVDGGQADFHIDLDVCLLGNHPRTGLPMVALADPVLGYDYREEVLAQDELFQGHFCSPAEARELYRESLDRSVLRRRTLLESYLQRFEELGYDVIKMPDLRVLSDENYLARQNFTFSYCNALALNMAATPTVCLLPTGLKEMEAKVEQLYGEVSVKVQWIGEAEAAQELMAMRGGLHCFCSILD